MNARTFGTKTIESRYTTEEFAAMHAEQVRRHAAAVAAGADRDGFTWKDSKPAAVKARATVTPILLATKKAVNYLVSLSAERFPAVEETTIREWAGQVHAAEVSAKIDWLKTKPKVLNSGIGSAKAYDVPAGRYAVTGEAGQTVFVKVSIPTDGPFAGRTFVNVQASDELHRVSATTRDALLAKIEADGLAEASKRYGREIGSCGVCGRTLTDEDSRTAGIGPKCAAKTGW